MAIGVVSIVVASIVVLWIMTTGMTDGPLCITQIDLSEPVYVEDDAWMVEVEDVRENCERFGRDLDEMKVILMRNNSTILSSPQLQNGLAAHDEGILIFFVDKGKTGMVDVGDLFYLVGLPGGMEYEFRIVSGLSGNTVGHATIPI